MKNLIHSETQINQQAPQSNEISNAGLILLSPFLSLFFTKLGLLNDGTFNSLPNAIKATQLLHYLIYGSSKTPEELLFFNIILCGLPPNTPIPQKIRITKNIKNECQSLLEHVIEQWSALKNTSTQGFVDLFLKRNAILTRNNNTWLLKVEPKAFDVLLDTLPWTINFVKFKWNDYLITTEWQG
jgi:Contractile injection system tape measure protein